MDLIAMLPPGTEHWLAYAALVLAILTAIAAGLRWAVPQLRAIAARTSSPFDDKVVNWLASALEVLAAIVDVAQIFLPRVTLGRAAEATPPKVTVQVRPTAPLEIAADRETLSPPEPK